jgi:AcrR family transcriptional regulator
VSSARAGKRNGRAGADEAPARGRGRPRSEEADQAILGATLRSLAADGIGGLTIEGVAAEAGVGKTTVYRRWPTKTDLIVAAVSALAPPGEPPDTGSLKGDLQALVDIQRARIADTPLVIAAPRVLAEAGAHPEIHAGFVRAVIEPIRSAIRTIVQRGMDRGEIAEDVDPDVLVDVLHAIPIYLLLLSGGDQAVVAEVPDRYLPLLLRGVSSSSAGRGSARPRSSGSSRARRARSG